MKTVYQYYTVVVGKWWLIDLLNDLLKIGLLFFLFISGTFL